MVNIIRRFQQPVLLFVTVVVIISFVYWLTTTTRGDRDRMGGPVCIIYGKPVSQSAIQRNFNVFKVAQVTAPALIEGLVGLEKLMQARFGMISQQVVAEEFAFNDYVLRHEAITLGIEPTTDEVDDTVKHISAFQTNGAFDSGKLNEFIQEVLAPSGMGGDQIEEAVRDELRQRKVKELVAETIPATPEQIRSSYVSRNQKTDASLIRLKLEDFKAAAQVTEDDTKKSFEERKETLKSPEKRKVRYVDFQLDEKNPPAGPAKHEALQKLADRAQEFSAAMAAKDAKLDEVAAKDGATVKESPEFAAGEPPAGLDEKADAAAFQLTTEQPNSDAILNTAGNGYVVLQLTGIMPSRPLTYEEAKPKLEEQIKNDRSQEAMNLKATEIRGKIDTALKAGKSITDAAKDAGATAEDLAPFSASDRAKLPQADANAILPTAQQLGQGELSAFVPSEGGGILLYVAKREPIDEADFEKQKATITKNVENSLQQETFAEWLKQKKKEANIRFPKS